MNQPPIDRGLSTRPVSVDTLLAWVTREAVPAIRALLTLANKLTVNDVVTMSATGTIDGGIEIIRADATDGSISLALPATPSTWIRRVAIIKIDATVNTVTITGSVFGPIVLATQWSIFEVVCDGVSYY